MKLITLFLFIGSTFGRGDVKKLVDDPTWDEIIDQALDAARSDIISNHYDIIHIPDIDQEIHQKIIGIPLTIPVKIFGGELWNVSSVSRRESVTILQDDVSGNITILTSLGLDKFNFNSSELYFHVLALYVNGSLNGNCKSNELQFSLSLITDKQDNCKAYLNWARLTKFQEFTIQILPINEANFFAQQLLSFALNLFPQNAMAIINAQLTDKLNEVISKVDICSYLPI